MQKTLLALLAAALVPAALANPYYNSKLKVIEFTSPSRNIRCHGDRAADPHSDYKGFKGVECSVYSGDGREPSLPVLPRSKDCELDETTVFSVESTGKAKRFAGCSGDPYYNLDDAVVVLPYGETAKGDGWQCTSSEQGMRCENDEKNGFSLSRARQETFSAGATDDSDSAGKGDSASEDSDTASSTSDGSSAQFDVSGLKKGKISRNCYKSPCAVSKIVSFKNRGPVGDGITVDLELLGGESDDENSPVTWNDKTHTVSVHCSKTKPSTTLDGKVEYLPIGPNYPAVLYSAGQLYMETCHNFKSYTVEDGAEKFGYDLENLDGETGEMRPAGS